jgi:MFS transporter, ACS family, tartrate transporter
MAGIDRSAIHPLNGEKADMTTSSAYFSTDLGKGTVRQLAWRLIPIIVVMYFLSYLDRVNVSFAALTMNKDLGLSPTVYGWGAGLFFLGYFIGEVPSNLALDRFGARRWLARIMISWGLVSAAMSMVSGEWSFYTVRFLLGLAEAGLFPGVILYLTYWFPAQTRSRMIALFLAAAPVSTLIGAPVSTWLLGQGGVMGLRGWQSMFVFEGIATALVGVYVFFKLPNRPSDVAWLTDHQRAWLLSELAKEKTSMSVTAVSEAGQALRNGSVIGYAICYLLLTTGLYGIGFWMPQLFQAKGFSIVQIGWLAAIASLITVCIMIPWSMHSDRTSERVWHTILPLMLATVGLAFAAADDSAVAIVIGLTAGTIGTFSAIPPFWTLPIGILSGRGATAGLAVVGAIGNLGGYFGPMLLGLIKDKTGSFSAGLGFLALSVALAFVLAWILTPHLRLHTARKAI